MTEKPQPKREVSISAMSPDKSIVYLYASKDAAEDIKEFGEMSQWTRPNQYRLQIDSRYDFQEVVDYIKNYG